MSASARGGAHPRTRRAFALKRSERWNRFSASHVLGTSLSDVKICKMQVRNGNVLHQNTVAGIDCNQGVGSGRRRGSEAAAASAKMPSRNSSTSLPGAKSVMTSWPGLVRKTNVSFPELPDIRSDRH